MLVLFTRILSSKNHILDRLKALLLSLSSTIYLVFGLSTCNVAFGELTKPRFNRNLKLKHLKLSPPSSLDFKVRRTNRKANRAAALPFVFNERLVLDERLVSEHYLSVAIIQMITYNPYDENVSYDKETLEKNNITLLYSGQKMNSQSGKIFKFRHNFAGGAMIKWVSHFGNESQTNVVVALYPESYSPTFIPSVMEGIVHSVIMSEDSL